MQDCISAYSEALNLQWTKAFGEGYVSKTQVKRNLLTVVNDYFNKVYAEQFQKNQKRKVS